MPSVEFLNKMCQQTLVNVITNYQGKYDTLLNILTSHLLSALRFADKLNIKLHTNLITGIENLLGSKTHELMKNNCKMFDTDFYIFYSAIQNILAELNMQAEGYVDSYTCLWIDICRDAAMQSEARPSIIKKYYKLMLLAGGGLMGFAIGYKYYNLLTPTPAPVIMDNPIVIPEPSLWETINFKKINFDYEKIYNLILDNKYITGAVMAGVMASLIYYKARGKPINIKI